MSRSREHVLVWRVFADAKYQFLREVSIGKLPKAASLKRQIEKRNMPQPKESNKDYYIDYPKERNMSCACMDSAGRISITCNEQK